MFNSSTGKVIADGNRYDEVGRTRNGAVFKVIKNGKVGLIDAETGKVIAPVVFDEYLCSGRGNHILAKSANGTGTMSVFDKNGVSKGSMDLRSSTQLEQARFMTGWCGSAMLIETVEQYKDRGLRMVSLKK